MADRLLVTDLLQSGRLIQPQRPQGEAAVKYDADFSIAQSLQFEFPIASATNIFGIPRAIALDNSTNPSPVIVVVTITGHTFTIPAKSSGVYPVNASAGSSILIDTNGGASVLCSLTFFNTPQQPFSTYADGVPIDPTSAVPVNLIEISGDPVVTGHGVASGALRVELPIDGTGKVGLNAGTNIIGKVGIDQTISGVTNGVEVVTALPAGSNIVGRFAVDQTTDKVTNRVYTPYNNRIIFTATPILGGSYAANTSVGGLIQLDFGALGYTVGQKYKIARMNMFVLPSLVTTGLGNLGFRIFNELPSASTYTDGVAENLNAADFSKLIMEGNAGTSGVQAFAPNMPAAIAGGTNLGSELTASLSVYIGFINFSTVGSFTATAITYIEVEIY